MVGIPYNVWFRGLCAGVLWFRTAHRPRNHTLYGIPPIRFVFQVTQKDKKLPDDGRLLPKHVEASIQNKGVVQISA
jgi:hypothetical protein